MADIDRIVKITITRQTTVPSIASFDNPIIAAEFLTTDITPNMNVNERVRSYGNITEITAAFGASSEVTLMATKIFAQNPRVDLIYVGRKKTGGEGSETWSEALTAMKNDQDGWYAVLPITRDEAEQQDVADWVELEKKIAGISSGDANIITGTGDIADYLETNKYDRSFVMYHPDSNEDNFATIVFDADFVTDNSIAVTINTELTTIPFNTDQDTTMDDIKEDIEANTNLAGIQVELTDTAGDNRTFTVFYEGVELSITAVVTGGASQPTATITYDTKDQYPVAAWVGKQLPKDPGSSNWAYKTLTGITSYTLLTSEINTIEGKKGNYYIEITGVNKTQFGTVGSGEYIDIIRGIDWLGARIQQLVFQILINEEKVPYTAAGIQQINSQLKTALQEGVAVGLLASFETNPPDINDISDVDKGNRFLPDVEFTAVLAGAVNKAEINGIVSL